MANRDEQFTRLCLRAQTEYCDTELVTHAFESKGAVERIARVFQSKKGKLVSERGGNEPAAAGLISSDHSIGSGSAGPIIPPYPFGSNHLTVGVPAFRAGNRLRVSAPSREPGGSCSPESTPLRCNAAIVVPPTSSEPLACDFALLQTPSTGSVMTQIGLSCAVLYTPAVD
jgi:hypothetical protein